MKSLVTRLLVLAVGLCFAFLATAHAQVGVGETRLKRAEQISITLTGAPPADAQQMGSQPYTISDAGTINLQYLRSEIKAVDLTPSELARHIAAAYRNAGIYTNPTINVTRVMGTQTQETVTVSGEVKVPGTVVWRPGLTIIEAISEKGGFSDFGNPGKVKLMRQGKSPQELDLRNISRNPANNVVLQVKDIILVPQTGIFR